LQVEAEAEYAFSAVENRNVLDMDFLEAQGLAPMLRALEPVYELGHIGVFRLGPQEPRGLQIRLESENSTLPRLQDDDQGDTLVLSSISF